MAVPIIKVSRKEVERWLAAGTLGDGPLSKDLDNGYYLVAMGVRFNDRFAKNWVPWVVDTYYGDDDAVYTASALEHESVDLDFTTCPVICYEIWQLVDDVAADYEAKCPSLRTSQQLIEADEEIYKKATQILYAIGYQPDNKIWRAAFDVCVYYDEIYCSNIYGVKGDCVVLCCPDEVDLVNAYFDLLDLRAASMAERLVAHTGLSDYESDLNSDDFPF